MARIVYLFELDSVLNTISCIEKGQKAVYSEVVRNGNYVVLSLNQLTDSRAFLAAVKDKKSYPYLLELFQRGILRVAMYKDTRSISQYVQNSIGKCLNPNDAFIFSGLPIKNDETELLTLISDALKYSDLSLLRERRNDSRVADDRERLDFFLRYVEMILALSVNEKINNPAKKDEELVSFSTYMDKLVQLLRDRPDDDFHDSCIKKCRNEAMDLLEKIRLSMMNDNHLLEQRSSWVDRIYEKVQNDGTRLAECIVHLCYNYTVEDSIPNVSKHYTNMDDPSFINEFLIRLEDFWQSYRKELHNTNSDTSLDDNLSMVHIPSWQTAVGIAKYHKESTVYSGTYEENIRKEQIDWLWEVIKSSIVSFGMTVFYCLVFCLFCYGGDVLFGNLCRHWSVLNFWRDTTWSAFGLDCILYCSIFVVFNLLSWGIVHFMFKWPDIIECFQNMLNCVYNMSTILLTGNSSYTNQLKHRKHK